MQSNLGSPKHQQFTAPVRPLPLLTLQPMQELDEAGQWESFLSAAGLINSPRDYGLPAGEEGSAGGAGAAGSSAGTPPRSV